MRTYDLTPAAFARYLAYEAMTERRDMERANAWLAESWRLWDGKSNLHFDRTGYSYYSDIDMERVEQYGGMGWASYPASYYDQTIMETDLYLIAIKYKMGPFLDVDLYSGELLETPQDIERCRAQVVQIEREMEIDDPENRYCHCWMCEADDIEPNYYRPLTKN